MIDSVLKGTGNSRFLKSAVPAGTSWADALAMLQAGTFPIDFNGINTDGFQQVGTPLNKANLLKDATAAQIGLPPSTTPDGMFQALGNTGELHVWRKTVVTAQEIPAGYTLGDMQTNVEVFSGGSSNQSVLYYDDSPNVDDAGNVTIPNKGGNNQYAFYANGNFNVESYMRGKYIEIYPGGGYTAVDGVWFVPSDAAITVSNYKINVSKIQKVTGYAKIPAGTTTTYPVSTNPNAYQEGDDAKEAGYTLGDVVKGNFELAYSANYPRQFNVAESVTVDEAGNITLNSPVVYSFYTNSNGNSRDLIKGKFVTRTDNSPPWVKDGAIYYIPTDAVISYVSTWYEIDRYQPVTGYAAIPAGTTIEYLGKLGDKARVQVLSYVGTGTSGSDNPVSITFDFVPKSIWVIGMGYSYESEVHLMHGDANKSSGNVYYFAFSKISWESKTVSWYNTKSDGYQASALQANKLGETYKVLAIG